MEEQLNENFLNELFQLCLKKKEVVEICQKYLKYQYLPNASYKEIWKQINREYSFNKIIPSIGVLYQNCKDKQEVLDTLELVKNAGNPNPEQVIKSFQEFIKNSICIDFYDNFQELYSQGKRDKAIELLNKTGEYLHNFSLRSEFHFISIFKDFRDRQYEKKIEKELSREDFEFLHPITGIDELDAHYPIKDEDVICGVALSGVGKTTQLVFTAVENARRGALVLYEAAEGSKQELEDRFDSCWTAIDKIKLEDADLTDEEIEKLARTAEQVYSLGGEIELSRIDNFGLANIEDVANDIDDFEKRHGKVPDILILDYLELFTVNNWGFSSSTEEKARRQAVARSIANLVKNKGIKCCFTFTQASNVDANLINSEEFVLTRNNISADKNLLDSFSLFYSLNQTLTEYNSQIMRIFVDKSRHSDKKNKQIFRIYTDYEHGRFMDRKRTLNEFASSLI